MLAGFPLCDPHGGVRLVLILGRVRIDTIIVGTSVGQKVFQTLFNAIDCFRLQCEFEYHGTGHAVSPLQLELILLNVIADKSSTNIYLHCKLYIRIGSCLISLNTVIHRLRMAI